MSVLKSQALLKKNLDPALKIFEANGKWNLTKTASNKINQKKPKLTDTEDRLVVGKMGEGYQVQTCSYKINESGDVMYSMVTTVSNTVLHICKLLRE